MHFAWNLRRMIEHQSKNCSNSFARTVSLLESGGDMKRSGGVEVSHLRRVYIYTLIFQYITQMMTNAKTATRKRRIEAS